MSDSVTPLRDTTAPRSADDGLGAAPPAVVSVAVGAGTDLGKDSPDPRTAVAATEFVAAPMGPTLGERR